MKKSVWRSLLLIFLAVLVVTAVFILLILPIFEVKAFLNPTKQKMTSFPNELDLYYDFCEMKCGDDTLAGWYIPAQFASENYDDLYESDTTIIFSHNYESNKDMEEINALYLARGLAAEGYNVLMFDYSGSGSSTGEGYMLGVREARELKTAVDYARYTLGSKHIVLLGWGFGAAAALLCDNTGVDAVIADSSYVRLQAYLKDNMDEWIDVFPFMNGYAYALCEWLSGEDLSSANPIESVSRAGETAYFFIQGADDSVFPDNAADVLYRAALNAEHTAEYWQIEGAEHIMGYTTEPENYVSRIDRFLDTLYAE